MDYEYPLFCGDSPAFYFTQTYASELTRARVKNEGCYLLTLIWEVCDVPNPRLHWTVGLCG